MRTRYLLALPLLFVVGLILHRHHVTTGPVAPSAAITNPAAPPRSWSSRPTSPPPRVALRDFAALEDLLARLRDAPDDAALSALVGQGYHLLLERLQARPALALELAELLADQDVADPATRMMVGALAGAGTRESQAALVALLARRGDDDLFLRLLIPTMGFAVHPGDELETALRNTAANDARPAVRANADLALGVVAANTSAEDPTRSARLVSTYLDRLGAARDPAELGAALNVLGNAGAPSTAGAITALLDDDRPAVRARAAEALRRIPTASAEDAILRALGDPDPVVRAAAAWSLGQRPFTAANVEIQIQALARESTPRVATALLTNLANAAPERPAARAAIEQSAHAHPVDDIRAAARSALEHLAA